HLRAKTLRALLALGGVYPQKICQLSREGRPRHPVLLPATGFHTLGQAKHNNLKEFLESWSLGVALAESDDRGLDLDIDRPADYEAAIELALSGLHQTR